MARASKYRVGTGRHVLVGVFIELETFLSRYVSLI